jgi:hypothetical protein
MRLFMPSIVIVSFCATDVIVTDPIVRLAYACDALQLSLQSVVGISDSHKNVLPDVTVSSLSSSCLMPCSV